MSSTKTRLSILAGAGLLFLMSFVTPVQSRELPPRGLVVDADGKVIGPLFYPNMGQFPASVLTRIGGTLVHIALGPLLVTDSDGKTWEDLTKLYPVPYPTGLTSYLVFETPDCSGTPYVWIVDTPGGTVPAMAVSDRRALATLYVTSTPTRPGLARTYLSQTRYPGVCERTFLPSNDEYLPATQIIDLNTLFKPPYSIR